MLSISVGEYGILPVFVVMKVVEDLLNRDGTVLKRAGWVDSHKNRATPRDSRTCFILFPQISHSLQSID